MEETSSLPLINTKQPYQEGEQPSPKMRMRFHMPSVARDGAITTQYQDRQQAELLYKSLVDPKSR